MRKSGCCHQPKDEKGPWPTTEAGWRTVGANTSRGRAMAPLQSRGLNLKPPGQQRPVKGQWSYRRGGVRCHGLCALCLCKDAGRRHTQQTDWPSAGRVRAQVVIRCDRSWPDDASILTAFDSALTPGILTPKPSLL